MVIAKQPNGKYCIWDKNGEIHINQTEDDYYNFALEEAREKFYMPGFIEGVSSIIYNVSDNKVLKDMGFDKPHSELMKYIPKLVTNQSYNPRDCETVGKALIVAALYMTDMVVLTRNVNHVGSILSGEDIKYDRSKN